MDAHVLSKLDQVLAWIQREAPDNLVLIVMKSTNDAAIVYQLQNNRLVPTFVERSQASAPSFLDATMMTADVGDDNVIGFRVSLSDKVMYLSKDSDDKPAVLLQESIDGVLQWVRLDVMFVNLENSSEAVVHGYGKRENGDAWSTQMIMDLSKWF